MSREGRIRNEIEGNFRVKFVAGDDKLGDGDSHTIQPYENYTNIAVNLDGSDDDAEIFLPEAALNPGAVYHVDITVDGSFHSTADLIFKDAQGNTLTTVNGSGGSNNISYATFMSVGLRMVPIFSGDASAITLDTHQLVTATVANVSAAADSYVAIPYAGTITKIYATISGAVTVGDAILSFELDGDSVSDGNVTIAHSGSAAGSTFSSTPTANNVAAAGDSMKIACDGGSTDAQSAHVTFVVKLA